MMNNSDYANLPDLILFEIFNHLCLEDRYQAGRACRHWYDVFKSPVMWKRIDVKVKSSDHLLKLFQCLPSSVKHLNVHCCSFLDKFNDLWAPYILSRLHNCCPGIKTVVFQTLHETLFNHEVKGIAKVVDNCISDTENKKIKKNMLQDLYLLSERDFGSNLTKPFPLYLNNFAPQIKVLDLSFRLVMGYSSVLALGELIHLEELYLEGCKMLHDHIEYIMKCLKKLKVLDLEGSASVNDVTFKIIQENSLSLEKLYLGYTDFEFRRRKDFHDRTRLPQLQMICLRRTLIDDANVLAFTLLFPSLKYIDVSDCKLNRLEILKDHALEMGKQLISDTQNETCVYHGGLSHHSGCHHFKKNYTCFN